MRPATVLLLSAVMAFCQSAWAAGNAPVSIGFLTLSEPACRNDAFLAGMRDLGYVEGKNFRIECRHANGQYGRLPRAAEALVQAKPSVIVALGQVSTSAAHNATRTIPIVMVASGDPVTFGFAASLARPGGNMTGLTYYAPELTAKRIELLKAVLPGAKRVAVLSDPVASPELSAVYRRDVQNAARILGLNIVIYNATNDDEIGRAFESMVKDGIQAVHALPNYLFAAQAQQVADLARFHNLPSIHFMKHYPALGGLMSYGPDYDLLHRRTAGYVDKILHGAKPGDLPVNQPERLELILNRSVATELGLTIPSNLLLRADKVIDQ
jgi:putative ABC transport system substrate-binding protein